MLLWALLNLNLQSSHFFQSICYHFFLPALISLSPFPFSPIPLPHPQDRVKFLFCRSLQWRYSWSQSLKTKFNFFVLNSWLWGCSQLPGDSYLFLPSPKIRYCKDCWYDSRPASTWSSPLYRSHWDMPRFCCRRSESIEEECRNIYPSWKRMLRWRLTPHNWGSFRYGEKIIEYFCWKRKNTRQIVRKPRRFKWSLNIRTQLQHSWVW